MRVPAALAAILLAGLAACGGDAAPPDTLRRGLSADPATLDPQQARSLFTTIERDFQAQVEQALAQAITSRPLDQFGNRATSESRDVTLNTSGSATGGGLVNIVGGVGTLTIEGANPPASSSSAKAHAGCRQRQIASATPT